MPLFRKKPVVISAVQFKASDLKTQEHVNFGYPDGGDSDYAAALKDRYWVQTLEGPLTVSENDWIITGVNGEHYPCKPDIFEKTYEPA